MEIVLSITALVFSAIAMVVSIVRHRESENAAKAAAKEKEAWMLEQIARWRRGELEAKQEPSKAGIGDVWVIEPRPGHRIVVGWVGHGASTPSSN